MLKSGKKLLKKISYHRRKILFIILFAFFVFLRFYELEDRLFFRNDQLDNAWAVKRIVVDHDYPLLGMVAKGNSGFNIGPGYYYLITPIYTAFGLHPIAAGYIAGLTSIFTFFVIFYVLRKIFSFEVAIIALFINTFSIFIINGDRIQWPVDFIVPVSFIVFYLLYKIILGKSQYLIYLGLVTGFSLHIHFTSIFYFILVLLTIPLFPRTRKTLYYILLAIPFFLIWLIPLIRFEQLSGSSQSSNLSKYLEENYHGFHLVRVLQLKHDAFIEFFLISNLKIVDVFGFLLAPLFGISLYLSKKSRKNFTLIYLVAIWILIPWLVFATYKGEITNYYFYITRPAALIIMSYLIYRVFSIKKAYVKFATVLLLVVYAVINLQVFFKSYKPADVPSSEIRVKEAIMQKREINYDPWSPDSYLYFIYKNRGL